MSDQPFLLEPDLVFVGGGIMSATLAILLKELDPTLTLEIFESLDEVAKESSNAWNNAGTGHAALCELNYTPQKKDGSIGINKAVEINEQFDLSLQFWAYLVGRGVITQPENFIRQVPHMSFVHGKENVNYLRKRFEALSQHHLFRGMEFTDDPAVIAQWVPLVMEGRDPSEAVAATRFEKGTDVNFGALTRNFVDFLHSRPGAAVRLGQKVSDVRRLSDGRWQLKVRDKATKEDRKVKAKFVFLGAGGGALPLLQKSEIPEGKGFGGFPVSGQWLRCDLPVLADRHFAKVYGKAAVGAPPMSVPHLDTRVIDGKKSLLFGPFAGITWKFLKAGSLLDLPFSLKLDNLRAMLSVGRDNVDLTNYLIGQAVQSQDDRVEALREFFPDAKKSDWRLQIAGQRVQIIKYDPQRGGTLQFGTEVVASADGTLSALLGASPGASTSVSIMLDLLKRCFPKELASAEWQSKLTQMIPSYGQSLAKEEALASWVRAASMATLKLG